MALHLHVICRGPRVPGSAPWPNLHPLSGIAGRFHSGVWKLSAADRLRRPDFIWLHVGTAAYAQLGGRVVDVLTAAPEHLTPGDAPASLDGRLTVTFDSAGQFARRRIVWAGTLKANSYALADYDLPDMPPA